MLIDLHAHTSVGSKDSSISPEELITKAKNRGISAICITDHDSYKGVEETQKIAKSQGILVIKGIELSTNYGNLLIYGVDINDVFKLNVSDLMNQIGDKKCLTFGELREIFFQIALPITVEIDNLIHKVHEYGGAVVLPHPFGRYGEGNITIRYYLEEYLRRSQVREVEINKLLSFIKDNDPRYFSILQQVDAIEVLNPLCPGAENNAAFILADYLSKNQVGASDCHTPQQVGTCVTEFPEIKSEKDFISQLRQQKITKPKLNLKIDNLGYLGLR